MVRAFAKWEPDRKYQDAMDGYMGEQTVAYEEG